MSKKVSKLSKCQNCQNYQNRVTQEKNVACKNLILNLTIMKLNLTRTIKNVEKNIVKSRKKNHATSKKINS